ncbi:MAG: hypothetical protein PHV06_02065 [bacterium]|nr:hypothetical protein [bacterium]
MFKKFLIIFLIIFPVISFSEEIVEKESVPPPRITGRLRNDLIYFSVNNENYYYDLFEIRLIVTQNFSRGRFFGDIRGYIDPGDSVFEFENFTQPDSPRLMRCFWKIYSGSGDITFGKTYITFGNPGIFNIFDMDKQVNLTDLSYDKEGIFAAAGYIPLNKMSGIKTYISGDITGEAGVSIFSNFKSFDYGAVINRINPDINIVGIYFKGDIEIGINGSWGIHFNDKFDDYFHEANLGFDYSYKKLIFGTEFYYNEAGAVEPENYFLNEIPNTYFNARNYMYNSIVLAYDEFLSFSLNNFTNLNDNSSIVTLGCDYTLSNNLLLNLQTGFLTGTGNDEFSRELTGNLTALIRIEFKF